MSLLWAWVSLFVSIALPPVLFFSLAGRGDLWYGWVYTGILAVLFSFNLSALQLKNPELLKQRMKPPSGRAYWTGVVHPVMQVIVQPAIAGLDHRFHWSDNVSLAGIVLGLLIIAIGMGIVIWAELVNSFFSGAVRIQTDRGQRVIKTGPYTVVRHPAYAGGTLALIAGGLALNSLVAMIPALVIALPAILYRTRLEDQMLRHELMGYADYAAKVRFRLIPGVW
jgi:protein-S-isoprenylcysteine O-methyltransferase Ste14